MNKKKLIIIGLLFSYVLQVHADKKKTFGAQLDQFLASEPAGTSGSKAQSDVQKLEQVQLSPEYSVEKILTRYSKFAVPRDTNDRLQSAHEKKSFYAALALLEIMIRDGKDIQSALNNLPEIARQDLESLQKHAEYLVQNYEDALWAVHRSTILNHQNNSEDLIRYIIQQRVDPAKKELQTLHSAASYTGLSGYFSLQYWRGLVGY